MRVDDLPMARQRSTVRRQEYTALVTLLGQLKRQGSTNVSKSARLRERNCFRGCHHYVHLHYWIVVVFERLRKKSYSYVAERRT